VRTAIDTNIISALWSKEPSGSGIARQLWEAKDDGALLIAPAVYVELLAYPNATESFVSRFLADTGITVEFHL
jgi:predicted nucleic acid-binding protein